ncbi:caspase family protein [Streptomyces sp. JB150]|uniref:caspase family protein n=1 Tax=Streptomyces sp. JB150 TaxID=2714844 RepID=UPI00140D70FC|nr:caspase family protein [Streptomyces sp. JB150]QIJ62003.1 caspase family protein [Streptomyces sp. JB150]
MTDARHALIIANDQYADHGLRKLKAPAQDATALADVLHDPQIGDFDVQVVRNASADTMRRRIQSFFNDRRRDDTLVLHFSCHGLKSESGDLYFAACDTEPQLLDATAVPAQFVRGCMSRTRAGRTVLFLDCCYGGAFSRGSSSVRATGEVNVLESFPKEKPAAGRGWAVITASNSMEYAFEGQELAENSAPRPSVFTRAVVQGLESGEADLDSDGEVSLDDLYDYVYEHVKAENPHQTPSKTAELQGELYLAHTRGGRIKISALPLPPALHAALSSENVLTRLGAVLELRNRLRNESLPLAEGARQALEEVARNDIRQIADEACRALDEIRLAPSADRLDFGLVPQGSAPQPKTVTLSGPPLARHCVAQPSQSWLRVDPTGSGLEVRVETAAEGHLSGDIRLKGVAHEAVIHVEAVVGPAYEPAPSASSGSPSSPGQASSGNEPEPPPHQREMAIIGPGLSPHPSQPPQSPPPRPTTSPADEGTGTPARSRWAAPALAAAALALAGTAVVTLAVAIRAGVAAVVDRSGKGLFGNVEDSVREHAALPPLTASLIIAAVALIAGALARHDLSARHERYSRRAESWVRALTAFAKGLAVPALILAVLTGIAYLVGSRYW